MEILCESKEPGYGPAESLVQSWIFQSGFDTAEVSEGERYFKAGFRFLELLYEYFLSDNQNKALFKSMSHMLSIGFGVYMPNVLPDMVATICVLLVGCVVFALFLSQMISLIDQINLGEKKFKRHLQEVQFKTRAH